MFVVSPIGPMTQYDSESPAPGGSPANRGPLPAALVRPHPERLDPRTPDYDEICERHAAAVAAGEPLYLDPSSGLWVMTAATLWERPCCDNGCRHCPHVQRDDT